MVLPFIERPKGPVGIASELENRWIDNAIYIYVISFPNIRLNKIYYSIFTSALHTKSAMPMRPPTPLSLLFKCQYKPRFIMPINQLSQSKRNLILSSGRCGNGRKVVNKNKTLKIKSEISDNVSIGRGVRQHIVARGNA